MQVLPEGGFVTSIYGPMFSGKSNELVRRVMNLPYAGRRYELFKPQRDTRDVGIKARMGPNQPPIILPAVKVANAEMILEHPLDGIDTIGIDEAQFFKDDFHLVVLELALRGKHVIVCGLNLNFRGEPFRAMTNVIGMAHEPVPLSAWCSVCKKHAWYSHLKEGVPAPADGVVLGDEDLYEARCIAHFSWDAVRRAS